MRKLSLLALSVSFALTGCGGDNSSDESAQTTIKALDGYLKNAVVFVDANTDGQWQSSEVFLGLTDNNGQLELDSRPEGTLAVQTVVPGGEAQAQLVALDSEKYAGIYTVDMDQPTQAMQSEVVFRSTPSSTIISPLTDLVAIEISNGATEEQAASNVAEALGDATINVYSDYIGATDNTSKKLHKTAQILTVSKVAEGEGDDNYHANALKFAAAAAQTTETLSEEELNDVTVKPVIIDQSSGDGVNLTSVTNSRLVVSSDYIASIEAELVNMNLEVGSSITFSEAYSGLFSDEDNSNITAALTQTSIDELKAGGLDVSLTSGSLILKGDVSKAGTYNIVIEAKDAAANGTVVATVPALITFTVASANEAPTVNTSVTSAIQNTLSAWNLEQNQSTENSVDVSELFNDAEGDTLTYSVSSSDSGLLVSVDESGLLTVSGTPTTSGVVTLAISAKDSTHSTGASYTFNLSVSESVADDNSDSPSDDSLGFTNAMFSEAKVWSMGSFNAGDTEVGFATFKVNGSETQMCLDFGQTLTGHDFGPVLDNLSESSADLTDCFPVTLQDDGTLTFDEEGKTNSFTVLYHANVGNGEQMVIGTADGELFWLDSANKDYYNFLEVTEAQFDGKVFVLGDDNNEQSNGTGDVKPVLFYYDFNSDGSFNAVDVNDTTGEVSEPGTWKVDTITEDGDTTVYLNQHETFDGGYERNTYRVRDFGKFSVYMTDKYADEDDADYIMMGDEATLTSIYEKWIAAIK
ncbi:hypothetical protein [Vibrio porteresiae]|uniref:Dystroglycan-type cadherin-like domain-containing protein n=1 Tax=Vibrio porteresiae DSM 19223 TaxID=1123496 RepID=A0ABZ0QB64_9VIBR|nr:hypothetical protein [Vibrio porteresiae]WPC73427.1 hypothetical protein R8Z52_15105 [Vibrio porteresiae DSM 19223]